MSRKPPETIAEARTRDNELGVSESQETARAPRGSGSGQEGRLERIEESLARLENRYGALLEKSLDASAHLESDWIKARDRAERRTQELNETKFHLEESKRNETQLSSELLTQIEESKKNESRLLAQLEESSSRDQHQRSLLEDRERVIHDFERQLKQTWDDYLGAREELNSFQRRFSWRITAPVRWIRALF